MLTTHSLSTTRPLVLVVDNSQAVTGALNAIRYATGPLRTQFGFVYVLPKGSTARGVLEADGYLVYELPFVEISRRKAALVAYLPMLLLNGWRLWRLARREGATIIHLNDFYNLTGYIARVLSLGKLPLVTHVRFLPQSLPQPLARTWRWLAEVGANQILCVSEAVRRYFHATTNVQVIYDPLPGAEHYPKLEYVTRPDAPVRFLYLGNYIRGKGQNFALQAFQQAYAQNPHLQLHFAGGDMGLAKNQEFRQELEAHAQAAGLANVVTFAGFAADTEQLIKNYDVVLNFSESESFSLTCLDALFYGVPLIATDCGGPAELFENGQSGWLVPNRDVPAMTEAIRQLAASAELRQRFSGNSRNFVRQKFAPVHTYLLLQAIYGKLLINRA